MSDQVADGGNVVQLRPSEAPLGDTPTGPATYAVLTPGDRRPILPAWLQSRDALKHHTRHHAGRAWHSARFHGARSPLYLLTTAGFALFGAVRLVGRWLRWWLVPVPYEVIRDSVEDGHRAWHRTHAVHKETSKKRGIISLAVGAGALVAVSTLWAAVPHWLLIVAGCCLLPVLALFGRPDGKRITQTAQVPMAYEPLTETVVVRALGTMGIAEVNKWLKENDPRLLFHGPIRQDGPGWRAEVDLPWGVTATAIIDRREQLASGLRRPLGAVWPEPMTSEHAGRLELWVGREDISKAKAPPWPLLKAGQVDVFQTFPYAVDVRGRVVKVPLVYHNWLLGSIPRQGKTAAVRVLACGIALDPLAGMWVHELKGTGDLDMSGQVAHRFVSGIDDPSIEYAAESLRLLRREIEKRAPRIKDLDPKLCPERRVTREIAQRYKDLRPLVCIIDEAQNLFTHDKYGKQAGEDAEFIIKVGPAMGVVLILATQRPDAKSLPKGISANVSIRFCLKVTGQVENDMILGTSAYKQGIRATSFRPKVDAGLGYLIGEDPAQVCRTYFLDVNAAQAVVARAHAARERAGTLTGYALGQDAIEPPRDPLADAAACFAGEGGLPWAELAGRLAERWPDRYAGLTADAASAQLRDAGVPSVTVSLGGQKARGARKSDIEDAIANGVTPRPEG